MKVNEIEDFQLLKSEWNTLLRDSMVDDNIFLTWEWLSTWWKHFGKGRRQLILLVEDENKILAVAPLMLSNCILRPFGSIRKIEFIGTPHSDYHNFIILGKEKESLKLIINYLKDNIVDWDWVELKEVSEFTKTPSILEATIPEFSPKLMLKQRVCNTCPYFSLPSSFELLIKELKRKTRQNLNRYLRKIKERHKVELKKYNEIGFNVKEAMNLFIKLHEMRWSEKGLQGVFESEGDGFRNFIMDVAEYFAEKGWLGLYFLMVDNKPISATCTFEYNQKMYGYLSGFDPKYSSYSIGNLTIMFLMEEGIKKGFKECDMLRGAEDYKTFWTSTYRRNLEIRLVRKNPFSRFYDWATWSNLMHEQKDGK